MNDKKITLSLVGIGLGAVALMIALVHVWAGPFSPQPSLEETVAAKAVAIKDAAMAALRGEAVPTPSKAKTYDLDKILRIATPVLGGLAVILGVIALAVGEPMRAAGGAFVLGASAIAFQFFMLALGAILLVILIGAVIVNLGVD